MRRKNVLFLKRNFIVFGSILFTIFFSKKESKFLSYTAMSEYHIAFIYSNDLWITDKDGSNPVRLTSDEDYESSPKFSQDGKHITFTAQYHRNRDVYIILVEEGIPKKLTYPPGYDQVQDFILDGKTILFTSRREVFSNICQQYLLPMVITQNFLFQMLTEPDTPKMKSSLLIIR